MKPLVASDHTNRAVLFGGINNFNTMYIENLKKLLREILKFSYIFFFTLTLYTFYFIYLNPTLNKLMQEYSK